MGHLKNKYTQEYFLNIKDNGELTDYGVVGLADFLQGQLRQQDKDILSWISFNNKSVLDLGFGRGEAIKYCYEQGAKNIIGVDFSPEAYKIADRFLKLHHAKAELYCQEILEFLKKAVKKGTKYDIVLLLDVIEHIPRQELEQIFGYLKKSLSQKALVIINTPIYRKDNDVAKDGLNPLSKDESDKFSQTQGMHINRYTKDSLNIFMETFGLKPISGHLFTNNLNISGKLISSKISLLFALLKSYPIKSKALFKKDSFEYAYQLKKSNLDELIIFIRTYLGKIKRKILPQTPEKEKPRWLTVLAGPLADHQLFLDFSKEPKWWQKILLGKYDVVFYNELKKVELSGKVVWDVGAHIGYHTLAFAVLVKDEGKVVAFEPNQFNVKRIKLNLKKNQDLTKRVKIVPYALTDQDGKAEFMYINQLENTRSAGSHLTSVLAPEEMESYKGFQTKIIKTYKADTVLKKFSLLKPDIIKIDIEGAEYKFLVGAQNILKRYKPLLLIEVHSITQMYLIQKLLTKYNYEIELLDSPEASLSRCFIKAQPKN